MSSIAYSTCQCCNRLFGYGVESALVTDGGAPEMCGMCRVRGGLCLHNLAARFTIREGDAPVQYHSSTPHDVPGVVPEDPSRCAPCIAAAERRAWLRRRT